MRRKLLAAAIVVLVLGGGTAAWAQSTADDRAARRDAFWACLDQARAAQPDAGPVELRPAVRACLEAKRITVGQRWPRLRDCFREAREAHPGDRPAIRQAVKDCMARE